jgi:hypothetical protein
MPSSPPPPRRGPVTRAMVRGFPLTVFRTSVNQSEDQVRVQWVARGTTTLNCPPGDTVDELAIDVWEHAYYIWAPLPGGMYETEGRGRGQARFQNPIIFDSDGSLTGAGVMSGTVECSPDACILTMDAAVRGPSGLIGRLS